MEFQRLDGFEALAGDESGEILQAFRVLEAKGVRGIEDGNRFVIAARAIRVRNLAVGLSGGVGWEVRKARTPGGSSVTTAPASLLKKATCSSMSHGPNRSHRSPTDKDSDVDMMLSFYHSPQTLGVEASQQECTRRFVNGAPLEVRRKRTVLDRR